MHWFIQLVKTFYWLWVILSIIYFADVSTASFTDSKVKFFFQTHKIYKAGLLVHTLPKFLQPKIYLGSYNNQHDNYFGIKDKKTLIWKLINPVKGETCCINRHFNIIVRLFLSHLRGRKIQYNLLEDLKLSFSQLIDKYITPIY